MRPCFQDALLEILGYGPRFVMSDGFVMSDEAQFRVLMVTIIENVLRRPTRPGRRG